MARKHNTIRDRSHPEPVVQKVAAFGFIKNLQNEDGNNERLVGFSFVNPNTGETIIDSVWVVAGSKTTKSAKSTAGNDVEYSVNDNNMLTDIFVLIELED